MHFHFIVLQVLEHQLFVDGPPSVINLSPVGPVGVAIHLTHSGGLDTPRKRTSKFLVAVTLSSLLRMRKLAFNMLQVDRASRYGPTVPPGVPAGQLGLSF